MANTFSAVASALSVIALFNNCVDCFGYAQLGCHFGRDFERCQLKLDIAWSRISRWGEAVAVNTDPRFAANGPDEITSQQAWGILDQIRLLFGEAQMPSSRYGPAVDSRALTHSEFTPVGTGLRKKFAWALYYSKNLDKLLGDITGLVGDLENLYSVEMQRQRLMGLEMEEVNGELSFSALQDAASGSDGLLAEVVADTMDAIAPRNEANDIFVK